MSFRFGWVEQMQNQNDSSGMENGQSIAAAVAKVRCRRRLRGGGRSRRNRHAFTLLELMLVMAILVMLASLAVVGVMQVMGGSKIDAATTQIGTLKQACKMYKLNVGRYPTGLNDLVQLPSGMTAQQWRGPYLDEGRLPVDPWGNAFMFAANETTDIVQIVSVGADGQQGTADDIGVIQQ